MRLWRVVIGTAGVAAWLAACEPVPPSTIDEVEIPPGFALQTERDVHLAVQLDASLRLADTWVTIALPDGRPLFEGSLTDDAVLDLSLPAGQDRLVLTASIDGRVVDRVELALAPGRAATARLGSEP